MTTVSAGAATASPSLSSSSLSASASASTGAGGSSSRGSGEGLSTPTTPSSSRTYRFSGKSSLKASSSTFGSPSRSSSAFAYTSAPASSSSTSFTPPTYFSANLKGKAPLSASTSSHPTSRMARMETVKSLSSSLSSSTKSSSKSSPFSFHSHVYHPPAHPRQEEDVLAAFPAPPNFIPPSPIPPNVTLATAGGGLPPSSFHYSGISSNSGASGSSNSALKKSRRESAGSTRSRDSTRSIQSLVPSVESGSSRGTPQYSNKNNSGRIVSGKRSGSKDSLTVYLNGQQLVGDERRRRDRSASPTGSNKGYVTAPSSPMYPQGEDLSQPSVVLGSSSRGTSAPASAPPSKYENRSSPLSSSPGHMSPIAEVTLSPSLRTSSLPKHDYEHIGDNPMTIEESSLSRPKIGAPPKVPLPPLPPPSAYGNSKISNADNASIYSHSSSKTAPSVRSVRSVRSEHSRKSVHGRKHSAGSVQSVGTITSIGTTTSNVAPSFSEFGIGAGLKHGERIGKDETGWSESELLKKLNEERGKRREERRARSAKTLKIDIPPTGIDTGATKGSDGAEKRDTKASEKGDSEKKNEGEGEKNADVFVPGTKSPTGEMSPREGETRSPTASVFSTTSGMSAAQSLSRRLSEMLEALNIAAVANANNHGHGHGHHHKSHTGESRKVKAVTRAPPAVLVSGTSPSFGAGGSGANSRTVVGSGSAMMMAATPVKSLLQTRPRGESFVIESRMRSYLDGEQDSGLLTAEDLSREPLLARAVTPVTPRVNGGRSAIGASPSPLELSSLGVTFREMQNGRRSPLVPLRKQTLSPIPPLSDVEDVEDGKDDGEYLVMYDHSAQIKIHHDGSDNDDDEHYIGKKGCYSGELSPGLLGQFPSTPVMTPQPDLVPLTSGGFGKSANSLDVGPAVGNGIKDTAAGPSVSRTISQSRRKPLPPKPNAVSVSTTREKKSGASGSSSGSGQEEGNKTPARGRKMELLEYERGDGSMSPDITAIMSATPKSARSSRSKSASARSGSTRSTRRAKPVDSSLSQSRRVSRTSSSYSSKSGPALSTSTGGIRSSRMSRVKSEFDDAYGGIIVDEQDGDVDNDLDKSVADYGFAIARHRGGYDLSPLNDAENLEANELGVLQPEKDVEEVSDLGLDGGIEDEGQAEVESDSDIDLHTPLPHILLREGVLSPYSRVLASENSSGLMSTRNSVTGPLNGRESVASHATGASFGSVMTKSGLFKDARNTETRRRRHRDGNQLRGGLGLTTGLGWSDSEDENAPSPFTSKLTLSRSGSMASVRSGKSKRSQFMMNSTPPLPVSRSASTMSLRSAAHDGNKLNSINPLSKSLSSANLARHGRTTLQTKAPALGDVSESRSMSPTPTSSSSASLPFPSTPRDDLYGDSEEGIDEFGRKAGGVTSKLSTASLRVKTPTMSSLRTTQSKSNLRPRTYTSKSAPSSTVSTTSDDAVTVRTPSRILTSLSTSTSSTPRPLRLPALQKQLSVRSEKSGSGSDSSSKYTLQPGQPAARSGSILGYNRNLHDRQRAEAGLYSSLSAPNSAYPSSPMSSPISPSLSSSSGMSFGGSSSSSSATARRAYGSLPTASSLRPPAGSNPNPRASPTRVPSGIPRTGTGMAYRQSSLPQSRVSVGRSGSAI